MPRGSRRASFVTAIVVLAALTPADAPAAATKLQGTISWTTTVASATDTPGGDAFESRESRTVTLKVRMTKRSGAAGWQPEDNGSSYNGRYTLSSTRQERDASGTTTCTTTHEATGSGSGALPRRPRSTTPPVLFGDVVPSTAALGRRTKALILRPVLRYRGEDTTTSTGSGISPCESSREVDPIDGSLAPSDSATQVCYPAGTSKRTATPQAGTLVGAWKARTRTFSFTCSGSFKGSDGETVTIRVTGSLRLR